MDNARATEGLGTGLTGSPVDCDVPASPTPYNKSPVSCLVHRGLTVAPLGANPEPGLSGTPQSRLGVNP